MLILALVLQQAVPAPLPPVIVQVTVGPAAPSPGWTLVAPLTGLETLMIGLDGRIVRRWLHTHPAGLACHLTPDGGLLRCARGGESGSLGSPFGGRGGEGGRLERWSAAGELVWLFELHDATRLLHHDAVLLPNGNVLAIAWELLSEEQVFDAGRRGSAIPDGGLLSDMLIEVRPTGAHSGEVVWQWRVAEHLVQQNRPAAAAFSDPRRSPGRIDVDFDLRPWAQASELVEARALDLAPLGYVGESSGESAPPPGRRAPDWLHMNSVDYDPVRDLVLVSVPGIGEVWVIDHSTTTAEARTGRGGRHGRGGDLLWRWGNPAAHGAEGPRELFGQHDARWVGDGRVLVFDNGAGRPGAARSRVLEVQVPFTADGFIAAPTREGAAPVWSYDGGEAPFFSRRLSGAQRLPNGNTLLTIGERALLIEVTRDGATAWVAHVRSPFGDITAPGAGLFRATRVPPDHPGAPAQSEPGEDRR